MDAFVDVVVLVFIFFSSDYPNSRFFAALSKGGSFYKKKRTGKHKVKTLFESVQMNVQVLFIFPSFTVLVVLKQYSSSFPITKTNF